MLKPVCDICKREVRGDIRQSLHFCDRCVPFAQSYCDKRAELAAKIMAASEKQIDQFRNEFLRDVVVPGSKPKMEVLAGGKT